MAEKKTTSRAQQAVEDAKRKSAAGTSKKKPTAGNKTNSASKASSSSRTAAPKKTVSEPVYVDNQLPERSVWAVISIILSILFLIMAVSPDGAVLQAFRPVIMGLFGKTAFYFSIPALLYIFVILVSSEKQPVRMRCSCLISFVLLCGCFYHLLTCGDDFKESTNIIGDLYRTGKEGVSGGVACGGFAMLVYWAFGEIMSVVLFLGGAILTLLGAMKITIPSVIRAIHDRPRDDWEYDDFEEVRPEPAALVVNHIANKRIEYKHRRIQRIQEMEQMDFDDVDDRSLFVPEQKKHDKLSRLKDLMNQIGGEVNDPVAAANVPVVDETIPEEVHTIAPVPAKTPVIVEAEPAEFETLEVIEEPEIPEKPVFAPLENKSPIVVPVKEKVTSKDAAVSAVQVAEEIAKAQTLKKPAYCFPPIDLLNKPSRDILDGTAEMRENSRRLNETLESFKIDAHIINVTRGPSVTRYEVELDKGVRLNKLTTVADDIALSLGAPSVRIAPVPGKISVVGIEVPNRAVTMVTLREVIDSPEFTKSKSKSSFSVGKDIGGSCIIGNIAKMPHMLIAGTTGSGKSVCMNSIIISLLYKASPEDVKLIMVDPKMVELANYNGIPHLMIPVVTDPKKAAGALQWAVTEMMRRYKTMSDAGVRDLESYNSIVMAEEGEKVPQLVVIIDELADLMLVAAKEVEDSICRIAQMGRAAGIHLVIATQRPSADVITGLMKANIPSRIAFSVASAMESRIILDTQGAEKLVGKGDMLFAPIGCGKPMRVQGCFVTDAEVEAVANYVKENYTADYDQEVLKDIEKNAQQTGKKAAAPVMDAEPNAEELDGDEMLPAAVDVILETGQASVSMLQRRLKLGYARAARIVDEMEEKGIVGPYAGSKPRSILITKDQWDAMRGAQPAQMSFDNMDVNSVQNNDSL